MFTDQICDAVALLEEALPALDPKLVFGRDAARMTEKCAEGERLLAAAKMFFAQRTAECGTWRGGGAVTEEQWLAQVSGTSEAAARDTLATAQRLDELPATEDKLRAGKLSLAQATQVTAGASIDPASEAKLLRVAERSGLGRLREEKERVVAAATDELEARRRAKRNRHLRTRANGVETTGTFSGPTEEVADLLQVLKPLAEARFNEARLAGEHESHDAYRFDALVNLARSGPAAGGASKGNDHVARVRVDLPALVRGSTEAGEVCEIPGVGPVPVAHAREVLSHGLLQLVITDGMDVRTVVSTTRHVPKALKIAIDERDQRCKIRGCDNTEHLERHHVDNYAKSHDTSYGNLGNVCPLHHDLVTHKGYEVVIHDDGTWDLRAPPDEAAA